MKRILLSIASLFIGLITLFTGLFMAVFIGIAALITGKRLQKQMQSGSFNSTSDSHSGSDFNSKVIEGEYEDISKK